MLQSDAVAESRSYSKKAPTTLTSSSPDLLIPHVIIQQRRNINEVLNVAHVHGGDVDDPRERGRSTLCDSTAIIKIFTNEHHQDAFLLLGGHSHLFVIRIHADASLHRKIGCQFLDFFLN